MYDNPFLDIGINESLYYEFLNQEYWVDRYGNKHRYEDMSDQYLINVARYVRNHICNELPYRLVYELEKRKIDY